MLDFAGPLQAFVEAASFGAEYRVEHCAPVPHARTNQGLALQALEPLPVVAAGDLVIVPGFPLGRVPLPQAVVDLDSNGKVYGAVPAA